MIKKLIFILLISSSSCKLLSQNMAHLSHNKIIIAHRGASGYLPEHTLESKAMAYAMKPDFIEQDIALSKDNIPVIIHDVYLDRVSDVSVKFSSRKRKDGRYYVIDFTFDELKTLDVFERLDYNSEQVYPDRFPHGKSTFRLHSLSDEIEIIQGLNKSTGYDIGIYPEIKNPSFHLKNGKDISRIVINILTKYGYKEKSDNCILQCFDWKELNRIRNELGSELFLVQLLEDGETSIPLDRIAKYADGIGPSYLQILEGKDSNGKWIFNSLIRDAHELGLIVHAYTFRMDELGPFSTFNEMLDIGFNGMKLDGIFTDFPDKAFAFLKKN